jgi:MFS family permease
LANYFAVTNMRPDFYVPDSQYAYRRLSLALLFATLFAIGQWAFVVVLPMVQADFGIDRAAASMPYTANMLGFAAGTILFGRMSDKTGTVRPLLISTVMLGLGFVVAGLAPNVAVFSLAHGVLIGIGAAGGFGPLMADTSHWFVKRRGLAVVIVASGVYLGGTIWPLIINALTPLIGWRSTYIALAMAVAAIVLPLATLLRRQPSDHALAEAHAATASAQANLRMSPKLVLIILTVAAFSCCVAMSMPQVHIVAYCGDLGYGVARGAEMLSLMLFLGFVSRVGSGFLADRIGGTLTLLIGSFMQAVALLLYLFFNGLTSLYVVSGVFGLFQGGLVPMYAVICREVFSPREAGAKIGILASATIIGMAFGGYISGVIFDLTGSYGMAFLNGFIWNVINIVIVGWLGWRSHGKSSEPATVGFA